MDREQFIVELTRSARRRGSVVGAVVAIDISGFGVINDTHGWTVGDEVLAAVGGRLAGYVPGEVGAVGRLGDDEFVLHLPGIADHDALDVAVQRLRDRVERAVPTRQGPIDVAVAVGARVCGASTTPERAIIDASAALADARSGHRPLVVSTEEVRSHRQRRLRLLADLGEAIDAGQLWLAYQPIMDANTSRPRSAEALLRWDHPVIGSVSPGVFVPIAEETDLIDAIGRWTIAEACRQIVRWSDEPWCTGGFRIAVNVSARQLRNHDVVADLRQALEASGADPARLRVEVTETLAMADVAVGIAVLTGITELGVSISLDDFGTGHSSLAQLGRLPIDELKIDRTFTLGLGADPAAETIVSAVLAIAEVFGIDVVAEGVERDDQLQVLRSLGCPLVQGWYFAEAEPADRFSATMGRLAGFPADSDR